MKLQVLGTGCPKCLEFAERVTQAAEEKQIEYTLEKITDMDVILATGVMRTPALLVDGEVKVSGRVPTVPELQIMLSQAAGAK